MKKEKLLLILLLTFTTLLLTAEDQVRIVTKPAGVGVFWEGKKIGTTPLLITQGQTDLPFFSKPGYAYKLILYKNFYEGEIISLIYKTGQRNARNITMKLLKPLPYYNGTIPATGELPMLSLLQLSAPETEKLYEEVFARYGRPIENKQLQSYFAKTRWYRVNPYYTTHQDSYLTPADIANSDNLRALFRPSDSDTKLAERILSNLEYKSKDSTHTLVFSEPGKALLHKTIEHTTTALSPYYIWDGTELNWKIINGKIYLWENLSTKEIAFIFLVTLQQDSRTYVSMQEVYNYDDFRH